MNQLKVLTDENIKNTYFERLPLEILYYIEDILWEIEFKFMRNFFKLDKSIPKNIYVHKDFFKEIIV
jgi:hypothetical protein